MTWTAWITFGVALIGAGLGVFNTWQGVRDRSVRLRVIPKYAEPVDQNMRRMGQPCLSIEVQNLGAYPVTIEEVGLLIGKSKGDLPRRAPLPPQFIVMGPKLPHRLERHDAISLVTPLINLPDNDITGAYARTAAGKLVKGTSAALIDVAEIIKSARGGR
jgi:hypothetical protein